MPIKNSTRYLLTIAAALATALGATGCLVGRTENTKYSGRYISEETLNQIEPGDSREEVESLFGTPTSKTEKSSGTTIWKYKYSKATTKSGAVFILFGSSSTTETEGAVYVELDDSGTVIKTWSER